MEKFEIKSIRAIIGLGNPGQKYYKTRHSIGFRVVDEFANRFFGSWKESANMEVAQVNISSIFEDQKNHEIYLLKPTTFMNSSGKVISFLTKKGIKPGEILVIHDELEKKFGNLSIRLGGSARGHNGLRSIMGVIGAEFWRFRFGIGRPEDKSEVGDYVLSNFSKKEEVELEVLISEAVDLISKE